MAMTMLPLHQIQLLWILNKSNLLAIPGTKGILGDEALPGLTQILGLLGQVFPLREFSAFQLSKVSKWVFFDLKSGGQNYLNFFLIDTLTPKIVKASSRIGAWSHDNWENLSHRRSSQLILVNTFSCSLPSSVWATILHQSFVIIIIIIIILIITLIEDKTSFEPGLGQILG